MAEPNSNSVKILEICRVQPNSDVSDSPISLPLTFFDLLWLRFPPVERLFFYEISNQNTPFFFDSILPKLKHSLSLTLQHFLPLAGNLIWPQDSQIPIVQYVHGDSVSLTIAESFADFYRLSAHNHAREAIESRHLVPVLSKSPALTSVIALQITLFPNCGLCIAISAHHAILDGKSSTMFMKAWAHTCKVGGDLDLSPLPSELTPLIERTLIKDPAGLQIQTTYINRWLNQNGPNNKSLMFWDLKIPPDTIRGTFELSRVHLEKLRASVLASLGVKTRASTFTLTCAYALVCLVKAEELKNTKVSMAFSADFRARLVPPIPANYFGSCVGACLLDLEANEVLGEDGFGIAVEAITKGVTSLNEEGLGGAEEWLSKVFSVKTERIVGIAGSPRFEIYKTDFGWGKPKKVEIVSIDRTGALSISDSRNGDGGVEVGLVLKKHEMETFASLFAKGLQVL